MFVILPLLLRCRSGEERIKGPEEERDEEFATGPLSLLMQVRRWAAVVAAFFPLYSFWAPHYTAEVTW